MLDWEITCSISACRHPSDPGQVPGEVRRPERAVWRGAARRLLPCQVLGRPQQQPAWGVKRFLWSQYNVSVTCLWPCPLLWSKDRFSKYFWGNLKNCQSFHFIITVFEVRYLYTLNIITILFASLGYSLSKADFFKGPKKLTNKLFAQVWEQWGDGDTVQHEGVQLWQAGRREGRDRICKVRHLFSCRMPHLCFK